MGEEGRFCGVLPQKAHKILKTFIEASCSDAGGEVVLRCGAETGRAFFVGGRIAWVVVSSVKRTFTQYLIEEAHLKADEVREVFEECKRTGKNFGETMIEWKLVPEETLRDLLLRQIAGGLAEVFSWETAEAMFVPEKRSYQGNLTFTVEEVIEKLVALDVEHKLPFEGSSAQEILDAVREVSGELDALATKPSLPALQPEPEPAPPPKKHRGRFVALLVVVLFVSAGASFFLWDRLLGTPPSEGSPTQDASASVPGEPADAGAPLAAEEPGAPADGGATPDAAADVAAAPSDAAAPPAPERIVAFARGKGAGSVRIKSRPAGATVYLDGVATDKKTPAQLPRVPAGVEHVILVERSGLAPGVARFMLENGMNAELFLKLEKKPLPPAGDIEIFIESEPPGAEILLNGKPTGRTTPAAVALPARKDSRLVLRLSGYKAWQQRVRPVPGLDLGVLAELKKK